LMLEPSEYPTRTEAEAKGTAKSDEGNDRDHEPATDRPRQVTVLPLDLAQIERVAARLLLWGQALRVHVLPPRDVTGQMPRPLGDTRAECVPPGACRRRRGSPTRRRAFDRRNSGTSSPGSTGAHRASSSRQQT